MTAPGSIRNELLLFALLITLLFAGGVIRFTEWLSQGPSQLELIREQGELVILTLQPVVQYAFEEPDLIEYDLAREFASFLGIPVRFDQRGSVDEIVAALEAGEGHLAAAGFTRTPRWEGRFDFSPPFYEVHKQVVCRRGGTRAMSHEDLLGTSLLLSSHTSYKFLLGELRKSHVPTPRWTIEPFSSEEVHLRRIWEQEADCTIAQSHVVAMNRRFFPELTVEFTLPLAFDRVWLLPRGSSDLVEALSAWHGEMVLSSRLQAIIARHYAPVENFDYVDTRRFLHSIEERLPRFRAMFERAGEAYGIDWRLLAAQAYQESHWNPAARSPTGVRGIMMLTLRTASDLGISSRLNAAQSIDGGARYVASLRSRLPESIREPDRTWIAMAAYNVGMGHVYDARTLAGELGYDPDTWAGLRDVLPKLSHPQYYENLSFGRARGSEPVIYVERIRNYYSILVRHLNEMELLLENTATEP